MKILLFGEFSGVFNNLADGLKSLGHEVILVNTGDGLKGFYSDYNWMKGKKGKSGVIYGLFDLWKNRNLLVGFDVVQFICPYFIPTLYLNKRLVHFIIKNNRKSYWVICGLSKLNAKYWIENKNPRFPFWEYIKEQALREGNKMPGEGVDFINYENWFLENINGIIPTTFEYMQPFRNHPKNLGAIPFPINTDKISYQKNTISNNKLVFYHGISRADKGTEYILDAFNMIRSKYKNSAEFICNKFLPYNEYLSAVDRANIILDQTNGLSSGMNGLIMMAKGKIVMGGAEPEGIEELGYEFCPIINITANSEQICDAIDGIMHNLEHIEEHGLRSRKFIETYHNYINVALKYIDRWNT